MVEFNKKLFEFLYYIEKQGKLNYTRTPVGKLAVNELIAGKPCWLPPTLPSMEKQKTLILADWSMSVWSSEKTAQVKKVLSELICQGFSIYIFRNGQVTELQQGDILSLIENKPQFATAKDVCTAALAQHKLTVDQIQVIDDYVLNQMLSDEERLQPRVLRTSEMSALSAAKLDQLITIINASKPPLSRIIHDCFSKASNELVSQLKQQWPEVDVDIQYTEADLKDIKTIEGTDNIIDGDFILYKQALQQLKSIDMHSSASTEVIDFVLKHASNLKRLNLHDCTNLSEIDFSSIPLVQLEEIDVTNSTITSSQLASILSQAKNLKKIKLHDCTKLSEIDFSDIPLVQLEEIDVIRNTITSSQLASILSQAKNLKKINLSVKKINLYDCTNLSEIDFSTIHLEQLEEICVFRSTITQSQLASILSHAKNLKKIKLCDCTNLSEIDFSAIPLEQLEDIDVLRSTITSSQLASILSQAKNLKKIKLCDCTNLSEIDFSDIPLEQLEEIDVVRSTITSSQLASILSQAKNLKKIKLHDYENLGEIDFSAIPLEQLEEIELNENTISIENLHYIFNATPKLDSKFKKMIQELIKVPAAPANTIW